MGVDGGGNADVGVAEEFLDDDEFNALLQEECRGRVVEVVKPDRPQAGFAEQGVEVPSERSGLDRVPVRPREDVPAALPLRARPVSLPGLPLAVCAKRGDTGGRQGDAPLGADGPGQQGGQPAAAGALQDAADAGRAAVQVEVFPTQAEEFALAQTGAERQLEQRGEPMALSGGEGFRCRRCAGSPRQLAV